MRGKINDLEEITVLDTVTDTDTYNYTFEAFFEEDFSRCDREEKKENQRESFRVSHFDCYSGSMISDRVFMVVFS